MKKEVLIAFAADPYLALFFKKTYDLFWKDEIDGLNIHINGKQKFIIDFIADLWKDDAKQIIKKYKVYRQGEAFNELYDKVNSDIVMTMDSDNFIYRGGVVNDFSEKIENGNYDYIGSKKPFMSFWNKKILDKIIVNFEEYHFKKGETANGFDEPFNEDKFYDVMELLHLRFFDKTKKIFEIPIDDLPYYEHIGRRSFFAYWVADFPKEKSIIELVSKYRNVLKAIGKINRAAYTYYIFQQTKKYFPFKKYNDYYDKMFKMVLDFLGFNMRNIQYSIDKKIKPRLPKGLK